MLEGARGLIHGITCGAGMPYRLAEIAARYNVYYYPIVSSAQAGDLSLGQGSSSPRISWSSRGSRCARWTCPG